MHACVLALFTIVGEPPCVEDRCDLIVLNHFYDELGRLVFDQTVFYDEWPDGEYHVAAWRLAKSEGHTPRLTARGWECTFWDGDILRKVRAPQACETSTQYDPELADREALPKEKRRDLTKPKPIETKKVEYVIPSN